MTPVLNTLYKQWLLQIILGLVCIGFLGGCDAPKTHKNLMPVEANDTNIEQLPLKGYRGILFTMNKDEVIEKFGCASYELTIGCPFYDGIRDETLWVIFNESGRMILMKRDMGYFNYEESQAILNRFTKKYTVAYEPSPATLNTYKIGLRDTLSFVFANGQVVFQVGRSYNKRNELTNIFIFPPDVGDKFLENVRR
jgi:hypothetical protein